MSGMVQKWIAENDSLCFSFKKRKEFERPWIIVLSAFILVTIIVIEYLVNGSHYLLNPGIIIIVLLFLWWLTIPEKANDAVIEKTVHDLMDDILASDAKEAGSEVIKSCVYYDTKGTYGVIVAIWLLVLLKNGQVWEYPIVHHFSDNDSEGYYECKRYYVVSDNQKHISSINSCGWRNIVEKIHISDNVKLWLLIFVILITGGVAFGGLLWILMRLKWLTLLIIGGYVFLYYVIKRLEQKFPSRMTKMLERITQIPYLILFSLVALIHPFIAIVGTYFFVVLFSFGIPAMMLIWFSKIELCTLRPETISFIVISIGSVLSSTHSVTKWIIRSSPLQDRGNHEYEKNRENLAYYLVHPSNMVFLLYLLYFVFLAISGFLFIQFDKFLFSESIDYSILKAFLVYIAYTNMRIKAKETEIDAKVVLDGISRLFVHDKS